MPRIPNLREIPPELRLPVIAATALIVAIFAVVLIPHKAVAAHGTTTSQGGSGGSGLGATQSTATINTITETKPTQTVTTPATVNLPLAKAVGQLIIATYAGTKPPQSLLNDVKKGEFGAVILMRDNTGYSVATTETATHELQSAARAGGNPGLLIMTDQEGGQVKRLPGAPAYPASEMGNPSVATQQGLATAKELKAAGINVDLAPVADVNQANGFMEQEQRSFGDTPSVVANASCAFANALAGDGVAYTLKHFPGLGDALTSTDIGPVSVSASAADINASDAAYRMCGDNKLALVMISSASYPNLTGSSPAVLAPETYQKVIKQDGINAVLISDSFESGAVKNQVHPALKALNDGLDMVMYPDLQSYAEFAYASLLKDARQGILSRSRITAAVNRVLELKRSLGLSAG